MKRVLGQLARDERGAVAPMTAALGVALVGAAGLALDVASYYSAERELRHATQAAALAAAMDPSSAQSRATAYLTANGFGADVIRTVEVGYYCADRNSTAAARFTTSPVAANCPGYTQANAIRLTTGKPTRRYLTAVLGGLAPIPDLDAVATAARIDEAGISVTSGVATTSTVVTTLLVNTVNALLSAVLDTAIALNTTQVDALMNGMVDAGRFFDALASRTGQGGSYGELVAGTYGLADIANAAADASANTATASALRVFAGQVGNGYQVPLAGVVGVGVWKHQPVGEATLQTDLRAGINAYQLIAWAARSGPGVIDASDAVSLAVPNSLVRIESVAQGPVARPRFAFGPAGETSAGTSAVRILVQLKLDTTLVGGQAYVPVLVDLGPASASVDAITCASTPDQRGNTRVSVTASSGLVNAYIGNPPAGAMTGAMPPLNAASFTPVTLVNLNLLGLTSVNASARSSVGPVFGNAGTATFGPGGSGTIGDPTQASFSLAAGTPVTLGNGSQLGPLVTSLVGNLNVTAKTCVLGLCLLDASTAQLNAVTSSITNPLGQLLGNVADPLLDNILAALGVELGHTTVWATGARCGVPVLV